MGRRSKRATLSLQSLFVEAVLGGEYFVISNSTQGSCVYFNPAEKRRNVKVNAAHAETLEPELGVGSESRVTEDATH